MGIGSSVRGREVDLDSPSSKRVQHPNGFSFTVFGANRVHVSHSIVIDK